MCANSAREASGSLSQYLESDHRGQERLPVAEHHDVRNDLKNVGASRIRIKVSEDKSECGLEDESKLG